MGEKQEKRLVAWYPFQNAKAPGQDASGNQKDAVAMGEKKPVVREVCGRMAACFEGGEYGSSYFKLPENLLEGISDENGITISTWVCADKAVSVWERLFDFGKGQGGPYLFLTRFSRGVCFQGADLFADAGFACPIAEWVHIAMTVTGTKGGTLSSAGPRVYVNGELAADGFISQTSSGTYKMLREWFATLSDASNYNNNFIGHSQFAADVDFCGALSDFRIYAEALAEKEIIDIMCESQTKEQILKLAGDRFLDAPPVILNRNITLQRELMNGRVQVEWSSDRPELLGPDGTVTPGEKPEKIRMTAKLSCDGSTREKVFSATVLSAEIPPYELTIHGNREVLKISPTLYGLFYEDINNAADGGIYAEMVQNRSFEAFTYDTYDAGSGENGRSTGRIHEPLQFWFGDTDRVTAKYQGGLNEHFQLQDADANACYVEVMDGTVLYNHGFCDRKGGYAMNLKKGEGYRFSIWAKAEKNAVIHVALLDDQKEKISNVVDIKVEANAGWKKYEAEILTAQKDVLGQLELQFEGTVAIDMVSLMPENVWGAKEEGSSETAHNNFLGNDNYRLRKDLVETLVELHPKFLRFPGGCISEGSYIWENVYDWKESVGKVETRKENFNVWGYMMTMGLGYMEYFQLAEDLRAEPLPVMACGVLCQARSDYANPAGGALREKYIKNFTDLIDFAISTDFEKNKWAALRKQMGHEAPFGMHYLGVGNENWGSEFFANFQIFEHAITEHMAEYYPDHELHIISTAGAQADDDAYQNGWKYLAGYLKGGDRVNFTDGTQSFPEEVTWYPYKKDYLDTIVDEHYYRSNEYLLENADRYNYYYRAYKNGRMDEEKTSKVFVGEYASSDKNTLAGAVAEAAVMTGFERNSDVVRLAATAPLFNKVVSDGTYRWTPDAIWFDNETVWRTPNYYVQQLFAKYIGNTLLETSYAHYEEGRKQALRPRGGITFRIENGKADLKEVTVTSNLDGTILLQQDFDRPLKPELKPLGDTNQLGFYIDAPDWHDYTVELIVEKQEETAEIYVGVGFDGHLEKDKKNLLEYCVGCKNHGTGLKVYKDGKEAYTMGDYSSSVFAGNLRACYDEPVKAGTCKVTVNYGGMDGKSLHCFHAEAEGEKNGLLECKLESYNREVYHAVTRDTEKVYIKLVNAEDFTKKVKVKLNQLHVKEEAEWIVLTGDASFVHMPNVNTREAERIVPSYRKIQVEKDSMDLMLPADSVNVIVLKLE